jgi:hypothetical protein
VGVAAYPYPMSQLIVLLLQVQLRILCICQEFLRQKFITNQQQIEQLRLQIRIGKRFLDDSAAAYCN